MAGVSRVASTGNVAPGKRKFVVALALIIALAFAVWLTMSFSAPARVITHKITLAAVALVKSPWEEKADDWKKMADAPIALLESAGAEVDGRIYVFGGIERTSLFGLKGGSAVFVYDPKTDSWTRNCRYAHCRYPCHGSRRWTQNLVRGRLAGKSDRRV